MRSCSSSGSPSRPPGVGSPEASGDVVLGALVLRVREDVLGVVELDEQPGPAVVVGVELRGEERRAIGHARRLLHVVRDDDHRVVGLQLLDEVLDAAGGDGVQCRTRLVHEQDIGVGGEGARDAEALLLAARHAQTRFLQPVLDLVPQRRLRQRTLDELVHVALVAGDAGAERDVLVDRLRERVRLLEHHADAAADLDGVDLAVVEVDAVVLDAAVDVRLGDEVVHAVEATEHGRLATTRGADEGGDLVLADVEAHTVHGAEVPVVDVEVVDVEDDAVGFTVASRGGGLDDGDLGHGRASGRGRDGGA